MLMQFITLCLVIGSCVTITKGEFKTQYGNSRKITEVDALYDALLEEEWSEDELACLDATKKILDGVKNNTLWAALIWDSTQRTISPLHGSRYQLGDFDQCLNPHWITSSSEYKAKYCLADIKLTDIKSVPKYQNFDPYDSTDWVLTTETKFGRKLNTATIGVCTSSVCGARSIEKLVHLMLVSSHLPTSASTSVNVHSCQEKDTAKKPGIGFYVFFVTLFLLFVTGLLSTLYLDSLSEKTVKATHIKIAEAFCFKNNFNALTKVRETEIGALHGIRTLTAGIIVGVHQLFYFILSGAYNSLDVDRDLTDSQFSYMMLHIDVVTDTFFVMSGLLFIRGLMSSTDTRLLSVLLKRYIRLIGPFAVMTFYMLSVHRYTGDGPVWNLLNSLETDHCPDTWWMNMLMLNPSFAHRCVITGWQIPCDYQLAIFATLLFYLYKKQKTIGVCACVSSILASCVATGMVTYYNKLDMVPYSNFSGLVHIRSNLHADYIYIRMYSRLAPYLIGVVMGFLVSVYKPIMYKHKISKHKSIIGATISLVVMALIICIGKWSKDRDYEALEAALVVALNRSVWAAAVCLLIAVLEYGHVPLINNFLSWSIFVPLSKLSYGVYLYHTITLQRNNYSLRTPLQYSLFSQISNAIGTIAVACIISFVLWFLVEAPLVNLSSLINRTIPKEHEMSKKKL